MKERPILMSAPMVRATLADQKTQTRRIVKPQPHRDAARPTGLADVVGGPRAWWSFVDVNGVPVLWDERRKLRHIGRCPYGQVGEQLWVRETVAIESWTREYGDEPPLPTDRPWKHDASLDGDIWYWPHYRATDPAPELGCERDNCRTCERGEPGPHWTPSIHMPRWASRITLEITDVRVERLRQITGKDAVAEGHPHRDPASFGVDQMAHAYQAATDWFHGIWESINGPGSWDANPWVWVISFRRITVSNP